MKKSFLLKLRKKAEAKLLALRTKLEGNDELREDEIAQIQDEVNELSDEIRELDEAIEDAPEDDKDGDGDEGEDGGDDEGDNENRDNTATPESRSAAMSAIQTVLSTRNSKSSKKNTKEVRRAFGQFVIGQITEQEARSLGIVTGNGSVTVPKEIASEVITYAIEQNPLRKFGTQHKTKSTQGFPVLVKKAVAQGHKNERSSNNPMPETSIEFDEIELDPTEFDALATVTKKLTKRSDVPVEEIVIEELKKAYVEKEAQYFFNGDEEDNINDGALQKKAVKFYPATVPDLTRGQEVYDTLVHFKNTVKSSIRKKSMFIMNDAALNIIETMKTDDGIPLFKAFEQVSEGFDGKILGFPAVVTEYANKTVDDTETPMIYFGDFSSFHYQDVLGSMEINRLVELYAKSNLIGLQIYNIVDGQLVYSPLEPTVYLYEVGATAPTDTPAG